jgi:hypothetical protein
MSYTTIAVAFKGPFDSTHDFSNSWGSAAFIWDKLAERYNIGGSFPGQWEALIKYHNLHGHGGDHGVEPFEHNALLTTYDRSVVKRSDMLAVAESLDRFFEVYATVNRVCTLREQASLIRKVHADGAEFLAWNQTSVSEAWYWVRTKEGDADWNFEIEHARPYDPHVDTEHTVADVVALKGTKMFRIDLTVGPAITVTATSLEEALRLARPIADKHKAVILGLAYIPRSC